MVQKKFEDGVKIDNQRVIEQGWERVHEKDQTPSQIKWDSLEVEEMGL